MRQGSVPDRRRPRQRAQLTAKPGHHHQRPGRLLQSDNISLTNRVSTLEPDNTSLTNRVSTLEPDNTSLTNRVSALEGELDGLRNTFAGISRANNLPALSGMNLQIERGSGSMDAPDGLGNLIIGYNENPEIQTGSHNLILGKASRHRGELHRDHVAPLLPDPTSAFSEPRPEL